MQASNTERNEKGFSLIEVMVAMGVMLVVSGAVFSLMQHSIKISAATYELTEAQESLRTAQEYINRDLMNAGDGLKSLNNITVPQNFVTNYLTRNPILASPGVANLSILTTDNDVPAGTTVLGTNPAVTIRSTPLLTDRQTIMEIDSNFGAPVTPAAINSAGTAVTILPADVARFATGEVYFISSSAGSTFGQITNITGVGTATPALLFATGDSLGLNGRISVISANGTLPASIVRMKIIHYFVDANGLLTRRVFGVRNAAYTDSTIAEHVVSVQFVYSLDMRDSNGNVVQPVTALTTSQQELAVRQVEVTVTVETTHALHHGQRERLSMNTSTSVRNMQFKQALQPN